MWPKQMLKKRASFTMPASGAPDDEMERNKDLATASFMSHE